MQEIRHRQGRIGRRQNRTVHSGQEIALLGLAHQVQKHRHLTGKCHRQFQKAPGSPGLEFELHLTQGRAPRATDHRSLVQSHFHLGVPMVQPPRSPTKVGFENHRQPLEVDDTRQWRFRQQRHVQIGTGKRPFPFLPAMGTCHEIPPSFQGLNIVRPQPAHPQCCLLPVQDGIRRVVIAIEQRLLGLVPGIGPGRGPQRHPIQVRFCHGQFDFQLFRHCFTYIHSLRCRAYTKKPAARRPPVFSYWIREIADQK